MSKLASRGLASELVNLVIMYIYVMYVGPMTTQVWCLQRTVHSLSLEIWSVMMREE